MAENNTIDLTDFLFLQRFLKFDYVFSVPKKSDSGKVIKAPIKEATDFTNKDISVKDKPMARSAIKDPTKVIYPLVGVILKKEIGLNVMDKKLIVLDIDCKNDVKRGKEVFDDVVEYISTNFDIKKETILSLSEMTISGGYHIFLTSNNIYDQKNLVIEEGINIEVFSSNKYVGMAPSIGYRPLNSEYSCVDLTKCTDLFMNTIDLDHFCSHFSTEKPKDTNSDTTINPDFVFDNSSYKRIIKDWEELETFTKGSNDRDWDKISDKSSYDYIRFNIMPIMALFNKSDEFLEHISQYGDKYINQWQRYPEKWLEDYENGTIILGSDARKRLNKIGALEKKQGERNTKQDMIEEFVSMHMPSLFEHVLVVHGAIYYYDKAYNCYIYLESEVFSITLGSFYKNKLSKTLKPEDFKTLKDTFDIYARIFSLEDSHPMYLAYDIVRDQTYKTIIPVVFINGTLYINNDTTFTFEEEKFNPKDKALFAIQTVFDPSLVKPADDSIIMDWFNTKFDENSLIFIRMFFGNLLIPSYNPSIMLSMYSYRGSMGKSTLAKALSDLFDIGSNSLITAFPLSALDDKFGGGSLSRSLLNITTELDSRIDSEAFKNVISRERWRVEAKFENAKYEIPLAKHIAMSNDMPKISADGGVTRRLAVFPLREEIARPDIEPHEYEQLFFKDSISLLGFMLQGLFDLMRLKFCDLSNYYRTNYSENIKKVQEFNSNVYEWLAFEGIEMVKNASKTESKGISKEELYISYKQWCNNEENHAVKNRTFLKYIMTQDDIIEKRITQTNDERRRLIVYNK